MKWGFSRYSEESRGKRGVEREERKPSKKVEFSCGEQVLSFGLFVR